MDYNFIVVVLLGFLVVALPMPHNVSYDPPPGHHTKTTTSTTSDTITEPLRSNNARGSGAGTSGKGTTPQAQAGGAGVANATATGRTSAKVKVGESGKPDKKGVSGTGPNQTQTAEKSNGQAVVITDTVGQATGAGSDGRQSETGVGTISKDVGTGAVGQQTSESAVETSSQTTPNPTVEKSTEAPQAGFVGQTERSGSGRKEEGDLPKDPTAEGVKDVASQVNETARFRFKLFGRGARRKTTNNNNTSSDTVGGWSFL